MILPAFDLAKLAVAAAVAAAVFLAGMATHKVFSDRRFAQMQAEHAEQLAAWERASAQAQAKAREIESAYRVVVDQARADAEQTAAEIAAKDREIYDANRRIAALDADARGLRQRAAAFAAGRGAGDTVAACQDRASRLGAALAEGGELLGGCVGLLAAGAELVREAARDADARRSKLTACLKAWPTKP